jgi:hypothetical protein
MKMPSYVPDVGRLRLTAVAIAAAVAVSSAGLLATGGSAQAAAVRVPLGTADSFVVLAGTGVTNTGPTTLNGDIGTFPTTSITGAGLITVTGVNHAGDTVTQGAKTDLVAAYTFAAGELPQTPIVGDLGPGGAWFNWAAVTP